MSFCPFTNKECDPECKLAYAYNPNCEMKGGNFHCTFEILRHSILEIELCQAHIEDLADSIQTMVDARVV